jgi:hypothetical protein
MNRKILIYGGLLTLATYFGLDTANEKVQTLRVFDVSVPTQNSAALSVQHFYPVFAQGDLSQDLGSSDDYQGAFFTQTAQQLDDGVILGVERDLADNVELVFEIPDLGPAPLIAPDPDPIEPINFLARYEKYFRLHATMPNQGAAIINGWAYNTGEAFPGKLNVSYTDEYGESHSEALTVLVSRVARGYVELDAESKQGWDQLIRISM